MDRLDDGDRQLLIAAVVVLLVLGETLILRAIDYLKQRWNRY